MTITELGALGEFVGAIAVVATLVFLTMQLRHNTRSVEFNSRQALAQGIKGRLSLFAQSPENASVFNRGIKNYADLADDEQMHFTLMLNGVLLDIETRYFDYRDGFLSEEIWESEYNALRFFLNTEGGVRAWTFLLGVLRKPFVDYVESNVMGETA